MIPRKPRRFLDRPLSVLRCFNPNNLELTANEISDNTGLPKTTTHRILAELIEDRLLEKNSRTKKYRIGPELYILGSLYLSATDVLQVAEPVTQTLNDLTGETILMGIFDNGVIVITLKEESRHAFRYARHVGSTLPAYASAMGKAFLSEMSEQELDILYPEETLKPIAPKTITTKSELKRSLEEIRKNGVSYTREEGYTGDEAVAWLVRDATNKAVAAMTIAVPLNMGEERRVWLTGLVKLGCSLISYRLGYLNSAVTVRDISEIRSWAEQNEPKATEK